MNPLAAKHALKFSVRFRLESRLNLRSGKEGEFADTSIDCTPDGLLHISGYVWASLLRRSLCRVEGGEALAKEIGKYSKNDPRGVSPLWCKSTITTMPSTGISPGIRIDRKHGCTATGALYNEELVNPGSSLECRFTFLVTEAESSDWIRDLFLSALWVVNEGIETVGGGWSYGHGRLAMEHVKIAFLDLRVPDHRSRLWDPNCSSWNTDSSWQDLGVKKPSITRPWKRLRVHAAITDSQLFAIHTTIPPDTLGEYPEMPDTFVFTREITSPDGKTIGRQPFITGKAFRQALLSREIERSMRSTSSPGQNECLGVGTKSCSCRRCTWFGSVDRGGIISVGDAPVEGSSPVIMHRIQLCEHSMQNMNFFSGEYLSGGKFTVDILVDCSKGCDHNGLVDELKKVLELMKSENSPRGWYRIGANTSCAGSVEVIDHSLDEYGGHTHA